MTPPDLPARPVPRAPLTDVVPKRTLLVIAVVVLVAVLGVVLALTLGDDGGSEASGNGGAGPSATSKGTPDTKRDDDEGTKGGDGSTSTPGSGKGGGTEPSAGSSAPAGGGGGDGDGDGQGSGGAEVESTHKGGQGDSIGLPKGWKFQSTGSAGDRFTGPKGQKLLVAWTSTPKGDPVADWKSQERYMVRSQYKKIRIEQVDYRGWNTADWEFTYVEGGTKYRTIDRGFVVNDHSGYALMYTAKAADWDSALRKGTWKALTGTFEPKA
jgi:hypothetical protein